MNFELDLGVQGCLASSGVPHYAPEACSAAASIAYPSGRFMSSISKTNSILLLGLADPANQAAWSESDERYRPIVAKHRTLQRLRSILERLQTDF